MRHAHNLMQKYQGICGWSDEDALEVALDYIQAEGFTDVFTDFLHDRALDTGATIWCPAGEHWVHFDELTHIQDHGRCQECQNRWEQGKFKQGWAKERRSARGNLQLGEEYRFSYIERLFATEGDVDMQAFDDDPNEDLACEVTTMPVRFDDGTLAANFLLTGYAGESVWRCIYVAPVIAAR